ncbi:putative membrane protein [Chryseobacterium ginsenosidimutans]|uniref:TMEM175 family protein n=1 Tax=Chryseobacterium ginsenosidimutans TaxID=687846 RepID=UPI00277D63F0|nr:TMEM175 family protein [Chryseobacterium ginsenosidimutans]MDQ0595063.1 putative membrane protein [Chryseobacterium ginsenosidimutans]
MRRERFDAITDAILAIIITLMVLEIKIPELTLNNVSNILIQIFIYGISFITIAIIWLNHHNIFAKIEKVDINSVWINFGLLFMISFIPSATEHLNVSFFNVANHIFYGIVTGCVVFFYALLQQRVTSSEKSKTFILSRRMSWWVMVLYFLSIPLSFISVYISGCIFLFIPILYFIQTKR